MEEKLNTRLCRFSRKCSGCQLQNMTYQQQLNYKQTKVQKLLGRFAQVDEIIGMENPFHYRNKVSAMFGTKNGALISGIYQSSTGSITPVEECLIEDTAAQEIICSVTKLAQSFKMQAYNHKTGNGFLRHVLVRRGFV
ncbi:MAG: 23S rRNA (uracil(1939)-C(5))-methyltransferase RlmD, partial [Oscillospiraceae bacterium]